MTFVVLTLFPELCAAVLGESDITDTRYLRVKGRITG